MILRPLRSCFRGLVGPFYGPLRGLGFLGCLWEVLEASPRPLGASCSRSWAHLGPVPGRSGAVLGASWAVLGPSWPLLGPSWGALGRSWRGLGGVFGRLGALEARNGEKAKNIEKTKENERFWPLQALPGRLSGLSWIPWGPLGGPGRFSEVSRGLLLPLLGPSSACSGAVWGCPGRLLGSPETFLARLGAVLGGSWAVLARSWGPLRPSWSVGSTEW